MTRTMLALICAGVCVAASTPHAYDGSGRSRPAAWLTASLQSRQAARSDTELLGLEALSPLLEWLSRLPQSFDQFVTAEEKEQLVRRLRNVAKGFANVNIDCETLAALAARPGITEAELDGDFRDLLDSIVQLRKSVLELAADLSDQWREEGSTLAFQLANVTQARADLTSEARSRLLSGDRAEATKRLRAAAKLAQDAQKMVIDFLSTVSNR